MIVVFNSKYLYDQTLWMLKSLRIYYTKKSFQSLLQIFKLSCIKNSPTPSCFIFLHIPPVEIMNLVSCLLGAIISVAGGSGSVIEDVDNIVNLL